MLLRILERQPKQQITPGSMVSRRGMTRTSILTNRCLPVDGFCNFAVFKHFLLHQFTLINVELMRRYAADIAIFVGLCVISFFPLPGHCL